MNVQPTTVRNMKSSMNGRRWQTISRMVGLVFTIAVMSACSSMRDEVSEPIVVEVEEVFNTELGNIEHHTSIFASELFETFRYREMERNQFRFAVSTFVPVKSLKHNSNYQHPLQLLGHQLEQGMMTEVARRGYISQDFKVTQNIILDEHADRVFTRDVDSLMAQHHDIDFYLSGTISETEEGAVVNARIVHVETKDVVAAATRFFPNDLFWNRGVVTARDGMIYRTALK